MSLEIVKEVWDGLKPIIQLADQQEAAETLINLLIDNDFESAEIKEMFRRDKDVMAALDYFNSDEETGWEEEEFEEDEELDEDY